MSISRELIRLGNRITSNFITDSAYQAANRLIVDTIGCLIAGYAEPGVAQTLSALRELGSHGDAHALIYGDPMRPDDAVLLNGVMIHALDLDDTHCPAVLHLMSKLFPTAVAVGEVVDASGQEIVEAIIAGMEIAGRVGRHYRNFEFLNSNVAGNFGVTYAACRLMKLTEQQTVDALGIGYSQICGTREALLEATLCKRIQPSFAARGAVAAAFLAKNGFTGPEDVFEGDAGLFHTFARGAQCPPPEVFLAPRDVFEIEEDSIKSYPTCGAHHGAIKAAIALYRQFRVDPEDILSIDLYLHGAKRMVGNPFRMGRYPQVNAQFSAPYAVALALLNGRVDLKDFRDQTIRGNQQAVRLAQKVNVWGDYDGELPQTYPRETMRIVRLNLSDGRELTKAMPNNESSLYPSRLTDEDVSEKFMQCSAYAGLCTTDQSASVLEAARALRTCGSIRTFVNNRLIMKECQ